MIKVSVRETWVVKPAEKTARRKIPLTVLDRVFDFPRCNSVVHIYRPEAAVEAAALREALSKTLVHFHVMAGRCEVDAFGITHIDCNDEGVLFVEADTDSDLEALGDLTPSDGTSILVPPINDTQDVSSSPLLAVQLTYFKCGGVSLGFRCEHQCADGASAFHLIRSWSEIARGLEISLPPFLDSASVLRPRDPPRPEFDHLEYSRYGPPEDKNNKKKKEVNVSVLKVSRDELDRMKAGHSTFEALAGHIWRCVTKARGVAAEDETSLMFQVNVRPPGRWSPELPRGLFGNVVARALAVSRAGDLESRPLSHAADEIRRASRRIDSDYSRSAVDHLSLLPDFSVAKAGAHITDTPNFQVTSWARMGLGDSGSDFGWGPPIYAGPGNIKGEKAYIFSPNPHVEGLSVAIALQAQHMDAFKKLFYQF